MIELDLSRRSRLPGRSLGLLAQAAEVPDALRVLDQLNARPVQFKRLHLNSAAKQGPESHVDLKLIGSGERGSDDELTVLGAKHLVRPQQRRQQAEVHVRY